MTTPLFLLRCVQLGLSMADLDMLSIGLINDMYAESRNDDCKYAELATQEDFDRFCLRIQSFSVILISRKGLSILSYKFEFNAHLKNENSQKRSHKMVMKGRITYE